MAWIHPETDRPLDPNVRPVADDWFSQFNGGSTTGITTPTGEPGLNVNSPTAGAPTGGTPPSGGGGADAQALVQQWQNSHSVTNPDLPGLVAFLQQHGINAQVATHGVGAVNGVGGNLQSGDAIILPGIGVVDLVRDVGGPNAAWQWLGPSAAGGGGSSGGGQSGPSMGGGALAGLGGYGGLLKPFTEQFTAPTAEQARQTPGYQFAMDQGQRAVQSSAAARGTLLTGGTLKALTGFGQGLADTTYGDTYNRAMNEYLTRYGIFTGNQDRPYSKLADTARIGLNAAQT